MADVQHTQQVSLKSDWRPLMLGLAGGSIAIIINIWLELAYNSIVLGSFDLPFSKAFVVLVFVLIAVLCIFYATRHVETDTKRLQIDNSRMAEKLLGEIEQIEQRENGDGLKSSKNKSKQIKLT